MRGCDCWFLVFQFLLGFGFVVFGVGVVGVGFRVSGVGVRFSGFKFGISGLGAILFLNFGDNTHGVGAGITMRCPLSSSTTSTLIAPSTTFVSVHDLGFRVQGFGFRVSGFGFRVWDWGLRGLGRGCTTFAGCDCGESSPENPPDKTCLLVLSQIKCP